MKNLITAFIALATSISAFAGVSASVGYRSKDVTFGRISSEQGAYVAAADITAGSFRLGTTVQNNLNLKDSSLYQIDLIGGYKFFSTLANVEFGTKYVTKGHPVKDDKQNHFRPFVEVSKGIFSIRGNMDLESQTSNIEGAVAKKFVLGKGFGLTPAFNLGYTDVNDAFPRSTKEVKYTNFYYGGSADLSWKLFTVGLYTVRPNTTKTFSTGYRGGLSLKF